MDFFSMLLNDPVVGASIAVIAATCCIVGYIGFYFIKNIIKSEHVRHQTE